MPFGDTVFAVVATELREEGHGLLGALGDELAEQPVHARANTGRWVPCPVGRRRGPRRRWRTNGCRTGEQFVGARVGVDRGPQYRQRVTVLEAHGLDFRGAAYRP